MLEVDKILEKCGDCGLMQLLMLLLFSLINVLSAMHYYSQTIISFVPKYWYVCCTLRILNNLNITHRTGVQMMTGNWGRRNRPRHPVVYPTLM